MLDFLLKMMFTEVSTWEGPFAMSVNHDAVMCVLPVAPENWCWWHSEEFFEQQRLEWAQWIHEDDTVSTFVSSSGTSESSATSSETDEFKWLDAQWDAPVESVALELSNEVLGHASQKASEAFGESTTRIVQKWVKEGPSDHGCALACHIDVLAAATDKAANYVVQLLARVLPEKYLMILAEVVCNNFSDLSRSEYGCRLVQRLLERTDCDLVAKYVAHLCISQGLETLIWHRWGTYVIGVFLESRSKEELFDLQADIASLLLGRLERFESDKSSKGAEGDEVSQRGGFSLNYGTYAVLQLLRTHADLLPEVCRGHAEMLLRLYPNKKSLRRLRKRSPACNEDNCCDPAKDRVSGVSGDKKRGNRRGARSQAILAAARADRRRAHELARWAAIGARRRWAGVVCRNV